jgi:hypothetical protein
MRQRKTDVLHQVAIKPVEHRRKRRRAGTIAEHFARRQGAGQMCADQT